MYHELDIAEVAGRYRGKCSCGWRSVWCRTMTGVGHEFGGHLTDAYNERITAVLASVDGRATVLAAM